MFDFLVERAKPWLVLASFAAVVAASLYLFNPDASWNVLLAKSLVPAPETQPGLDIEPIQQFFAALRPQDQAVYLYYEGFADALFYLSVAGFSFSVIGLTLKKWPSFRRRTRWLFVFPFALLGLEVVEGATLLSIMYLSPARFEVLLWISDIATAGKIATYGILSLLNIAGAALLLLSVTRGRS